MKRILFALALSVVLMSMVNAQTVTKALSGDNLSQVVDVWQITAWSPFTSDSAATVTTNRFSIAAYDSIDCWVRSTSVVGVPKFTASLMGSFDGTNYATTALGTIADTTATKTEVLSYVGRIATKGATLGRISVTGSGVVTPNEEDTIVNLYLVARKRGH